jgi:hypothetical protein
MTKRAHRTFAITLALTAAAAASALAAGALKGKTYEGTAPAMGVSQGHHVSTHASGNIILRVAGNGRSVSVLFSGAPVLYCTTQQQLHVQTTKSATISGSGTFRASIGERFAAGPGPPAITQVVSGRFSGSSVRGSISTRAAECGGVASFSATAR